MFVTHFFTLQKNNHTMNIVMILSGLTQLRNFKLCASNTENPTSAPLTRSITQRSPKLTMRDRTIAIGLLSPELSVGKKGWGKQIIGSSAENKAELEVYHNFIQQ